MSMEYHEALLLVLKSAESPIRGRTAVQKMTYFCSLKVGSPKEWGYRPHYYGPYSDLVALGLQDLVQMGYVVEAAEHLPSNRVVYTYSLTKDGRAMAKAIETHQKKSQVSRIREVVHECMRTSHEDVNVLSWAAKVYFVVTANSDKLTVGRAMEEAKSLGWKLAPGEIEKGVKLLQELRLVRVS